MTISEKPTALADVYAGDNADLTAARATTDREFSYAIEADADPDVLGRVANLFNLTNRAPKFVTLRRRSEAQVSIVVTIGPIDPINAEMICRKLRQLTCVVAARLVVGEAEALDRSREMQD